MKVKAKTSFAGEICMAMGEVRDVPESVAAPLLECGYLEPVEAADEPDQEPPKPKRSRSKEAKTEG